MSDNTCTDTNQIAAAAAAYQLLVAKRLAPLEPHTAADVRPEVDALTDLTMQIKDLESETHRAVQTQAKSDSKSNGPQRESERTELASLYCRRAQLILEYVDYDASARFSTVESLPNSSTGSSDASSEPEEQHDDDDTANDGSAHHVDDAGVEKALEDAETAISLAPTLADGYFLAALCDRCLGNTSRAIEHINRALEFAPQNASGIQQLANQLAVDANECSMNSHAPPLTTPTQLLTVFENANQGDDEQTEQQQDEEEPDQYSADDNGEETKALHQMLQAGHRRLASIAASSSLGKLEQMMHQNVHHQCATRSETLELEAAFEDTASFLWRLLGNPATVSALGLTDRNGTSGMARDMLAIATSGAGARLLVENRVLRKWVAQTLAPAARRYPTQPGRAPLPSPDSFASGDDALSRDRLQQTQEAVLAMLVRDALLILTRLLLALAGWRRCTSMPHALLYAELCSDLAREVGAREGSFSGLSRFEMLCSDAYGRGLLELTPEHNDALQIHQENFQAALATQDASYELRSHHLIGQVYARMGELELAHAEFSELLELSHKLGESQMECLAQYELGDCCVQRGNLPLASAHFKLAQTLSHQTAQARGSWRPHSVRQAIAFYAAMKPARRGAIRVAAAPPTNRPRRRRGSLAPPPAPEESSEAAAKFRRPAIWIGPPKLQLEHENDDPRSLLRMILGEQAEPALEAERSSSSSSSFEVRRQRSATEKLFARTSTCGSSRSKRPGAWRDSVFAVPPSYAELKSLAAAAALTSPIRE